MPAACVVSFASRCMLHSSCPCGHLAEMGKPPTPMLSGFDGSLASLNRAVITPPGPLCPRAGVSAGARAHVCPPLAIVHAAEGRADRRLLPSCRTSRAWRGMSSEARRTARPVLTLAPLPSPSRPSPCGVPLPALVAAALTWPLPAPLFGSRAWRSSPRRPGGPHCRTARRMRAGDHPQSDLP